MNEFTAGILTIGDELLIGQILDTNSSWLGKELVEAGWKVRYHHTVGDREQDIVDALRAMAARCRIILVSGGLGPTSDDRTLQAVSSFSDRKLVFYPEVKEKIEAYFQERGRRMLPSHSKQFYLPEGIEILKNEAGTAPGLHLEHGGVHFFFMPGVPSEMKYIYHKSLLPRLRKMILPTQAQVRIFTAGIGETDIVEKIQDDINTWPAGTEIAYLPYLGGVRLRITAEGKEVVENQRVVEEITQRLRTLLGEHFISLESDKWNKIMQKLCVDKNIRLATAESCTGGFIASQIVRVPGSSAYFTGSIVSYANEVKQNVLGVREETLRTQGAVSAECAEEMLDGLLRVTGADVGIAVTGIAGPDGGTPEKPVGTVYVSVGDRRSKVTKKIFYKSTRSGIIEYTYHQAMYRAYKFLSEE